jgi:hypothetical protein
MNSSTSRRKGNIDFGISSPADFRQNCQVLFASALTRLLSHCLPGICGPSGSGCHSLCGYADADLNRPKIPRSGQGIRMVRSPTDSAISVSAMEIR